MGLSVGMPDLFHFDAARWCGQADYRDRVSELYPTDKESIQKRRGVVPFIVTLYLGYESEITSILILRASSSSPPHPEERVLAARGHPLPVRRPVHRVHLVAVARLVVRFDSILHCAICIVDMERN